MKALLTVLLSMYSSGVFAITLAEIYQECDERQGNSAALKQFANWVEGQPLTVNAEFTFYNDLPVVGGWAH